MSYFKVNYWVYTALGAVLLSACEQPKTFVPTQTERFLNHDVDSYEQANRLLQADYVFVLDYSSSMHDKIEEVLSAAQSFTDYLIEEEIDYRVGIIKGTTHANSASTIAINFVSPFFDSVNPVTGTLLQTLAPLGQPNQPNTPYLLEAALRTMTAQAASFLRPAAQLVYVFMTDSDDRSHTNNAILGSRSPEQYAVDLARFKSSSDYVSSRSYTVGVADNCAIPSSNYWENPGTRVALASYELDSAHAPRECLYTPAATALENLARNVTRLTSRFTLVSKAVAASVRVFIDNSEVLSSGNWSFNAASNEIVFIAGREPAASSSLRIEYELLFGLSRSAKVDTIAVTVDGTSVAKDDVNGWSFVSEENRIVFNGSSKPASGADVRIFYQAL